MCGWCEQWLDRMADGVAPTEHLQSSAWHLFTRYRRLRLYQLYAHLQVPGSFTRKRHPEVSKLKHHAVKWQPTGLRCQDQGPAKEQYTRLM